jgi:hypothetical protein
MNYFDAEAAIVERLNDLLPELKAVLTPFSIGDMVEASQLSPTVHVIYGGDQVASTEGRGQKAMISQRWLIVLAVRAPKAQLQQTSDIRVVAGDIIPNLLQALQGWQAIPQMRPLVRVNGPAAGYSSTFAYFPFLFEGLLVT